MEVQIAFMCVGDYVSKYWSKHHEHQQLVGDIKRNALETWHKRADGEHEVRFLQKMSANYYRFLTVKQSGNKLIVSR